MDPRVTPEGDQKKAPEGGGKKTPEGDGERAAPLAPSWLGLTNHPENVPENVMAGLDPAIHIIRTTNRRSSWPGLTRPSM